MIFLLGVISILTFIIVLQGINITKLNNKLDYYKTCYKEYQANFVLFRALLWIAIKDMKANGWYSTYKKAYDMLLCRVKPYIFEDEVKRHSTNLLSAMLYWQNDIKLSADYEQDLINVRRNK